MVQGVVLPRRILRGVDHRGVGRRERPERDDAARLLIGSAQGQISHVTSLRIRGRDEHIAPDQEGGGHSIAPAAVVGDLFGREPAE